MKKATHPGPMHKQQKRQPEHPTGTVHSSLKINIISQQRSTPDLMPVRGFGGQGYTPSKPKQGYRPYQEQNHSKQQQNQPRPQWTKSQQHQAQSIRVQQHQSQSMRVQQHRSQSSGVQQHQSQSMRVQQHKGQGKSPQYQEQGRSQHYRNQQPARPRQQHPQRNRSQQSQKQNMFGQPYQCMNNEGISSTELQLQDPGFGQRNLAQYGPTPEDKVMVKFRPVNNCLETKLSRDAKYMWPEGRLGPQTWNSPYLDSWPDSYPPYQTPEGMNQQHTFTQGMFNSCGQHQPWHSRGNNFFGNQIENGGHPFSTDVYSNQYSFTPELGGVFCDEPDTADNSTSLLQDQRDLKIGTFKDLSSKQPSITTRETKKVPERQDKKAEKSLHLVTATIKGIKHWSKYRDSLNMLFEIFGVIDSAVVREASGTGKEFQLKDEQDTIKCVFYEIDRELPRLTRGHWHRCVGTIHVGNGKFKCISVRPASSEEKKVSKVSIKLSDNVLQNITKSIREP